jgi:formylglycine-generating enzyme required for sulfatase activity
MRGRSKRANRRCYANAGLAQVYANGEPTTPDSNSPAKGWRLPAEAEWQQAAAQGLSGQRFPWGNVINQRLANCHGHRPLIAYDLGPNGVGEPACGNLEILAG